MAAPAKKSALENLRTAQTPQHTTPQVATLVHRDVFAQMDPQFQLFLVNTITTAAFRVFCDLQKEKVKDDLMRLAPRPEWSDEEFARVSKDMRLVWRFWSDLLDYATDLAKQNRANEGE